MQIPNYKEARKRNNNTVEIETYTIDDSLTNIGLNKKYYIKTYGCQMNEHDTENIKALLEEMSFTEEEDYTKADIVMINTCSIRENAHNKAFGMLGRFKHLKEKRPDVIVGLCGCMAQEEGVVNKIIEKYKWLDFVFGTHNIHRFPEILSRALTNKETNIEVFSKEGNIVEGMPAKRANKYKAYVNIMYGCDKFCTYCIVPYTRGKQRSRTKEDIIKEIEELISSGYKEVTLLGQNVNAYGKDFSYNYNLENLLEDVSKTNIERIYFMTSHPWDFTDGMIEVIKKHQNIMPYIHLPVQSGSSKILKLMGRRYTKEDYLTLFDKIRMIPNVTISTDIIVGFPGETEEDFQETIDLVKYCKFDNGYSFIFSARENTPALKLPDTVSLEVKKERLYKLNEILNKHFLESNKKMLGKKVKVLVEGMSEKEGMYFGYTEQRKLVNFTQKKEKIGAIIDVEITAYKTWSLDGRAVEE